MTESTRSKGLSIMPAPGSRNRKKNFLDVKWLLLSGALVSTLGFWGVFTRLDNKSLANAAVPDPTQTPEGELETSTTQVLLLPPMPTLVPPAAVNIAAQSNPAAVLAAPAAIQVTSPIAPQAPVKILLGGSMPSKGGPEPVTRTSSSR
jgi:hypothetical protein